jgi:hypothetical protein
MTYLKEAYVGLSDNSLSTPELFSSKQRYRSVVESKLGRIINVEKVSGGLIHYVYRVSGEKQNAILKIRGNSYSTLPDIAMNPKDIQYEHRAIQLLSAVEPSTFPRILGFDEELSMIIETDVMPKKTTLENELNGKRVTRQDMKELGETVARVHRKLEPLKGSTRDGEDEDVYNMDLFYRLGFRDHPVLDETVEQLKHLPKQLILADLSPKNIGRGENEQITICDFDSFFRGNVLYALAFLAGHILLHNLDNFDNAMQLGSGLIDGYQLELPQIDVDSLLFKRVALGSLLYRLNNPVIPYTLPLSEDEKLQKTNISFGLLQQNNLGWIDIIYEMTSPK